MNILTIDFDIIMHWDINLYNDSVGEEVTIQDILNNCPNSSFTPQPDHFLYKYLTNFLNTYHKKYPDKKIYFIKSHEEIYKEHKDLFPAEEVYNIDQHHDLGYDDAEFMTCGNWAKVLYYKKDIKKYIWIYTDESDQYDHYFRFDKFNINVFNIDSLLDKVDCIVICKSPEWVPDDAMQLCDLWEDLFA